MRVKRELLLFAAHGVVASAMLLGVWSLYVYQPVTYAYFISEDRWAEYASFGAWFLSFAVSAWTLWRYPKARKPGLYLVAFGAFVLGMEEISWGQRIFGFDTTDFLRARNEQQEFNLHNWAGDPRDDLVGMLIIAWCVGLLVVTKIVPSLGRLCERLGVPVVPVRIWPFFLLAGYFFIEPPVPIGVESAEMLLPIAVAALSVDTAMRFRGSVDEPVAYGFSMAGMFATVALGATVLTQAYPVNEEMWTFRELASVRYPRIGMYRQALELFDHIKRNPGLVDGDLSFYEAVVLMKIGAKKEARAVLARILDEQKERRRQWPDDAEAFRETAKVHAVLERPARARRHFEIALKLDERRLEQTADRDIEFKVRRSLAKTLLAMGKAEAAEAQVARAIEIAPDPYNQMLMRHWIAREERRSAFMSRER